MGKGLSTVLSSVSDALGLNPQPSPVPLGPPHALLPNAAGTLAALDEFGIGPFLFFSFLFNSSQTTCLYGMSLSLVLCEEGNLSFCSE